jgi:hypothetical protein
MQHKQIFKMYYGAAPTDLEKLADEIEALMADLDHPRYHKVLRILAYRRPWRPKRVGWVNVEDQALHFSFAAIVLLPALFCSTFWAAGLSGLVLGSIREWEQWREVDLKIPMITDRLQDISFFVLGAVCLFFIKTVLVP